LLGGTEPGRGTCRQNDGVKTLSRIGNARHCEGKEEARSATPGGSVDFTRS
jgi:hypothetical protein